MPGPIVSIIPALRHIHRPDAGEAAAGAQAGGRAGEVPASASGAAALGWADMGNALSRALRWSMAGGLLAAAAAIALASPANGRRRVAGHERTSGVRIWMRDVVLFPFDNAPATVRQVSGTAIPTRPGGSVDLDDVTSYAIHVRHAEMVIPAATMEALMNQYILPQANTAIKRVSITFDEGVIAMRGTIQKGAPIGFTAQAVASPTSDGEMRITVTKMKTAGIVPKGVMDALGLKMDKVAQPHNQDVFHIVGDTMIVPVSSMFPPPKFFGPLRSVRVTPQGMIAVVGGGADASARVAHGPYIRMSGGRVTFSRSRLVMAPAAIIMVPKARAATLGFAPAHYYAQLLAGYSVNLVDGGLVSHVADYRAISGRR